MGTTTDRFLVAAGLAALIVLAGCVTALAWHGTINGQAAIGYLSTVTLAGIVGGVGHVAVGAGARAAVRQGGAPPPP